jgi:hypothetical protein
LFAASIEPIRCERFQSPKVQQLATIRPAQKTAKLLKANSISWPMELAGCNKFTSFGQKVFTIAVGPRASIWRGVAGMKQRSKKVSRYSPTGVGAVPGVRSFTLLRARYITEGEKESPVN